MRSLLVIVALLVALPARPVESGGTLPASLCDWGRQTHCRSAGGSRLLIRNSADDAKDGLVWQWMKGAATTLADFGVPTEATAYALCLYAGDSTAAIAEAGIAPSATLWSSAGQTGFAYRNPAGSSDGIRQVALKSGDAGKASAVVRGKGAALPDPLSGPLPLPVTVQLVQGADAACFEAIYGSSAVKNNGAAGFKARIGARSLYVSASGALDGKGSAADPYRRITDAVARARAERSTGRIPAEEEIQIHVAPGRYVGSFRVVELQSHPEYEVLPILLDVPGVALIGSTVLVRDDRGLPTTTEPGTETILEPDAVLRENQHLLLVTRTTNGGVGDRVTVEGFALDGKYEEGDFFVFATTGVYLDRVSGFRVRNNLIHRTTQGVISRLASGAIEGNRIQDNRFIGSLVSGGSLVHPAAVLVYANRSTGSLHGFGHTAGGYANVPPDLGQNTLSLEPLRVTYDRNNAEDVPQIPDTLTVTISGNDASDNAFSGIRLAGIFQPHDYNTADPTQPITSTLSATVTGNTCERNGHYGVLIDASRIPREVPREFNLTLAASYGGNTLAGNPSAPALFTFSYWGASAGWPGQPLFLYAFPTESTFELTDLDGELTGFDYDHPATDPISGSVLDNVLIVNGVEAPHGTKITPP